MRRLLLILVGLLLVVVGLIWFLQGLGIMGGSPMSGITLWAVVGPIVGLVGLWLLWLGVRRARS